MPAPTVDPPAAPAAPAPAAPISQPQRAAQTTISVSALPKPVEPTKPPKPGSARAKLFDDMGKKFGGESPSPDPAPAPKGTPATSEPKGEPGTTPKPATPEPGESAHDQPGDSGSATKPEAGKPGVDPKTGKVSPWKLADEHKAARIKAEQEAIQLKQRVTELEKQVVPQEKINGYETRIKELTNELRYYNAEKHDPDVLRLQQQHESAWKRAIKELTEITLTDPATGESRPATGQDLYDLVQLPLGQARQVADKLFGPFADDVMAHRKEIQNLMEQKAEKLEELRKTGAQREEERSAQMQKQDSELNELIQKSYAAAIDEAIKDEKHGQYFRPREGQDEWNSRLSNGFKFVDESMSATVKAPNLTPEQRVQIVRRHAAVRNRAAAFGPLRWENEQLRGKLTELETKLKEYEDTTPPAGGRAAAPPEGKPRGMAGLMTSLEKIARPG